jgi:polysaccharide export outer membrane protein
MIACLQRGCFAVALIWLCAQIGWAQPQPQRPAPAQVQQAVQSRPELTGRLQSMIQSSGQTPDQIRSRLRAEGYSEDLLNPYLPGAQPDSSAVPDDDVFAAVRALGLADATELESLRTSARGNARIQAKLDSAFLDTLMRAARNDSTRAALRRLVLSSTNVRAQADSGFDLFGLDVFQRQTTQFTPNFAGPVPSDYRVGPGDQLVLVLTGDVESAEALTVTREGLVFVRNVGEIPVANLTMTELESVLYSRLGRAYSGIRRGPGATTRFTVGVSKLGTNQVSVLGDVTTPGAYPVSKLGTMLTALYAAGGPTSNGNFRTVELRRGGQLVGTLDLYDYLLHGDASHDMRLEAGDVLFVPPRGGRVRVTGAVIRPATYELKPGETVGDAIRMAGGYRAEADTRRIEIDRILPPAQRGESGRDRVAYDVPDNSRDPLQAGDVVHVREVAKRIANRVTVNGNVWSPGAVAFQREMRLSEALRRAGGLKPDSYLGAVQIARLEADSTRRMLRVGIRDTSGTPEQDLVLQPDDEIRVFSLTDYRPQRFVTITGAVRKSGPVPYREGMTLRDLVMLANGLQESALLSEAEIARMPESRAKGAMAVTERVSLDSTYLFDRGADGRYLGPPGLPALAARAPEVVLRPYDNVLIYRQPDWSLPRTVTISGEVKYPGQYTLRSKNERISDLIERAGGLTVDAYPAGIAFTRQQGALGRIGVDLPAVLRDHDNIDNLLLVDGDAVSIPVYSGVVTVRGAVNTPVTLAYVNGADLDYYIRAAGGGTPQADLGKAYVTQPNGKVESRNRRARVWTSIPKPEPGAAVSVPLLDPNDKRDWLQVTGALTASLLSLLGSLVAIAAIVKK